MFNFKTENLDPSFKIIGIGEIGCNTLNVMMEQNIEGFEFVQISSDLYTHDTDHTHTIIQLTDLPIKEGINVLKEILKDTEMVIIISSLGDKSDSYAIFPLIKIARALNILTISIATVPRNFAKNNLSHAKMIIKEFAKYTDSFFIIDTAKLLYQNTFNTPPIEFNNEIYYVLSWIISGMMIDIGAFTEPSVDLAAMHRYYNNKGQGAVGIGTGKGHKRDITAIDRTVKSLRSQGYLFAHAETILISITCGTDLRMKEMGNIIYKIFEAASKDTDIIKNVLLDSEMNDEIRVVVCAIGLNADAQWLV